MLRTAGQVQGGLGGGVQRGLCERGICNQWLCGGPSIGHISVAHGGTALVCCRDQTEGIYKHGLHVDLHSMHKLHALCMSGRSDRIGSICSIGADVERTEQWSVGGH